jgi:hypothetical protein
MVIPVTPHGQSLPVFTRTWLKAISDVPPKSLSDMSARPAAGHQQGADPAHRRCFSKVALCVWEGAINVKPWEASDPASFLCMLVVFLHRLRIASEAIVRWRL